MYSHNTTSLAQTNGRHSPDSRVVEIALLLPAELAMQLEAAAHGRGLTPAQLIRHLIKTSVAGIKSAIRQNKDAGTDFA
jgi:hypothetical protein